MRNATLIALARTPLLAPDDLALLRGIAPRVARRALDARVRAGDAGDVVDPATRHHLYYLTAAGVRAAAHLLAAEPEEIASRYGLTERALLRRLPALERLHTGRAVLLCLAVTLAGAGGALEDWRAYPVRWPFTRAGHQETLVLDGEATLRFADGARCVVGYLWDGDTEAPEGVLAARLERLAAVRACPAYMPPQVVRVPPVLLVTADAARIPPGYRPGLLWTTMEMLAVSDPLSAAWRSTSERDGNGEGRDLRAALDRLGRMPLRPTPVAVVPVSTTLTAPTTGDALRHRAARVRTVPTNEPAPRDLMILPLVLPPRAWPLLRGVGEHPLLSRFDLAAVLERDPFDTWELLRALCAHGLCKVWRPQRHGHAWRYSLTTRGTTLLAHAAGLTPGDYRRLYGVLDDARRSGEHGLSYACGNIEHTDGINATYLAFLTAARMRGGGLWWRGEWACTRTYRARDRNGTCHKYTLRPDAELCYDGPGGPLHAFLEIDRDNESAKRLAAKVAQYDNYRAATGDVEFAVLLVTLGPGRSHEPLSAVGELARERRVPPLDLRATTAVDLTGHGPWASIWRDAHGGIHPLAVKA